jgi:hypothetical protein
MRIEQAIASAVPSLEVQTESFNDYDQALSHARSEKRCGLLLVLDDTGSLPTRDVIKNLLKPWETAVGLDGYAVLVSTGTKKLQLFELMAQDRRIIDYLSAEDFQQPDATASVCYKLWDDYVQAVERDTLPLVHQDWLILLAKENGVDAGSIHFCQRLGHFFRGKANLSWMESFALPWVSVTDALAEMHMRLGPKAGGLFALANSIGPLSGSDADLLSIAKSKSSTASKVKALIKKLDYFRIRGELLPALDALAASATPTSSALVRTLVAGKSHIIDFADDAAQLQTIEKAG